MYRRKTLSCWLAAVLLVLLAWSQPARAELPPAEAERVEALLAALAKQTDLVFIRNGEEYKAAQAVSHLRAKLNRAKKYLSTAEDFIDNVASVSSTSGEPYMIKRPGQEPEPARMFLYELLVEVAPKKPSRPAE